MATYSYFCENCQCEFSEKMSMTEYVAQPSCPLCNESYDVYRDFQADEVMVIGPPHTLGSLADKNTSQMSADHKSHLYRKHNEYKFKEKKQ